MKDKQRWIILASGGGYLGDIFSIFEGHESEVEEHTDLLYKEYGKSIDFDYISEEEY